MHKNVSIILMVVLIFLTNTVVVNAQTIQGLKLGPFAQHFNDPGATITVNNQSLGPNVNPYFFNNLQDGTYTVNSSIPQGYNIFSSICINCTDHPSSLYTVGPQTTVNVPQNGFVDLTWIYLPIQPSIPPVQSSPTGIVTKLFDGSLPTELGSDGKGVVYAASVMLENNIYKMWYGGQGYDGHDRIHYAESTDGLNWTKKGMVIDTNGANHVNDPDVIKVGSTYYMYHTTSPTTELDEIHLHTSTDGINWQDRGLVLGGQNSWDKYVARPSVGYYDGVFKMWYDGRSNPTPGSEGQFVGYATSPDGINWTRHENNPVFADDAYDTGRDISQVAAINIRKIGSRYVMVYQAKGTKWASSLDGINWNKHGLLINANGTPYSFHVTPKIFLNQDNKPTAIYMAGVNDNWEDIAIGIIKLKGNEFDPINGDANNDQQVDGTDYIIWLKSYGQQLNGTNNGDFNSDNIINEEDYNIWANTYNTI